MSERLSVSVTPILEELERFPVVFLHAGALFEPATVIEHILSALKSAGRTALEVPVASIPASVEAEVLLVSSFDRTAISRDICEELAQARASVMRHLEAGRGVIAVSSIPKVRLLGCPGSQLIIDARAAFLAPMDRPNVSEHIVARGFSEADASAVATFSEGLPALANRFVEMQSEPPRSQRAAERARKTIVMEQLRTALTELGWETAVALEAAFANPQAAIEDIDPMIVEALRGAGLVRVEEQRRTPSMSTRLARVIQSEVRFALDSHLKPPNVVSAILQDLWSIERTLRWTLQQNAAKQFGVAWRIDAFTEEVRDRVVDRAWRDAAIVNRDIAAVGNPFDWLTLDELVSLFEQPWAAVPTCPPVLWRRLLAEVLPIRNRLAHFRLPALNDAATALKWRRDLENRLTRS